VPLRVAISSHGLRRRGAWYVSAERVPERSPNGTGTAGVRLDDETAGADVRGARAGRLG
jgi:hypothetical protein